MKLSPKFPFLSHAQLSGMDSNTPLMFDRVMEGRPIAAKASPLLKLPVEVLALVMGHVSSDEQTLASLALVNSDCRQLARSCQFCTVHFDCGPKSSSLLSLLTYETAERSRSRLTKRPSLGACIRSITVTRQYLQQEVHTLRSHGRIGLSRERWDECTDRGGKCGFAN